MHGHTMGLGSMWEECWNCRGNEEGTKVGGGTDGEEEGRLAPWPEEEEEE